MSILRRTDDKVGKMSSDLKTIHCFGANYELAGMTHHGGDVKCAMKESVTQFAELIRLDPEIFYSIPGTFRRIKVGFTQDDSFYKAILNLIYVSRLGDKDPTEHLNNVFKDFKASTTEIYCKMTKDPYGNMPGDHILIEIRHHRPSFSLTIYFKPCETRIVTQI
jgi:hypothetical protein